MKPLCVALLLIGLSFLVFAVMAHVELRSAGTSETVPTPDSMPLARIVAPELFNPQQQSAKPETLAEMASSRIHTIGGVAILLMIIAVAMFIANQQSTHARN